MFSTGIAKQACKSGLGVSRPRSPRAIAAIVAFVALAGFALLTVASTRFDQTASADNGAMASTQGMVNQALQILGNKQMPVQQRRRELRELIEPRFDFTEMSRMALGYHWRDLSPAQRTEFTQLFAAFIETAYLSKIQDYSGQQVAFVRQSSIGSGYVQIDTQIVGTNKAPIPVNYLVEPNDKIYDVTVDNISIIANYRNQFNRVINERGFDQLMADLRSKQQQLASLLGG